MNTEEMLHISGTWVDSTSKAHAAILTVPELKGKLQRMSDTHAALSAAAQPPANARLAEISAQELSLDRRHDSIIRGSYGYLTAMAELVGGDQGEALISLRDTLIPDGLSSQQKSYRAQAGQAAQLEDRLTPAIRAQTDAIVVGAGVKAKPLTAYLTEWIIIGKEFGTLENEKGRLLASQAETSTGAELVKRRNKWIRLVNAFVADGELAELPADVDALVFGPLRDAEKRADARVRTTPRVELEPENQDSTGQGEQ